MRFARFAAALFLCLGLFALARPARAQTVPPVLGAPNVLGIVGPVQRLEPDGVTSAENAHPHPGAVPVNSINFADCSEDLQLHFALNISSIVSGWTLEVWAGASDCTAVAARSPTTATCWPVTSGGISYTQTTQINIRVRDILSQVATGAAGKNINYTAAGPDVCQQQVGSGATVVNLYFFFVDGSANAGGTAQPYPITADTRAGDVAGDVSVDVGDTLLFVNLPANTDTDTKGWNVYCDPPPGSEDVGDVYVPVDAPTNNGVCPVDAAVDDAADSATSSGDDAGDAGLDAEGGTAQAQVRPLDTAGNPCGTILNEAGIPDPNPAGTCLPSLVLIPGGATVVTVDAGVDEAGNPIEAGTSASGGTLSIIPDKYLCGQFDVTQSQLQVSGLKNKVHYNIAVAARDGVGNVGPLSNVACQAPAEVEDFYKTYWLAGGRAGGGFCSTDGAGVPASASALLVGMLAAASALVRRRRRS